MAEKPVSLIAFQYAKPEKRDELKNELMGLLDATRKEPGCIAYELHNLADDPSVFVFYEAWESQQALDDHFNAASFQEFWGRRMDYLTRDVEIKFLSSL
jgi:quinol monooxygenase YgiN